MLTARRVAITAAALLASFALTAPAQAKPPDRKVKLERPGPATWDGAVVPTAANQGYDAATGKPCGNDPDNYCDVTLLHVKVPNDFWRTRGGGVEVAVGDFTVPASDFDLYIYKSDREGHLGKLVDDSAGLPGAEELADIPHPDGYYRIQVVYFQVVASGYKGTAGFNITGRRAARPPDVDHPPGLQDVLASNPRRGFRSHSEMHIAQDPTRPRVLVAASKFYNKDRDSLAEYEFKIGTYVSFDSGRHWRELGQTDTCRQKRARASTWPENRCYPRDNPRRDGTGMEDRGHSGSERPEAADKLLGEIGEIGQAESEAGTAGGRGHRRGGDFGEEYITSDPWVQFDDEGNAYLMVLDSPPFESGNGWGMSFHRWSSVSRKDLRHPGRRTWSKKYVINDYPDEPEQSEFLDDKNTFAVNNAGDDRDGGTGPMVACWGQNVVDLIKQQEVCSRSTDRGKTWSQPIPISPASQQLVIGVSVVADNQDPNTFYAIWLHYAPGVVGAPDEYWFSKSVDGGQTWTAASLVAQVQNLPTQFPGQDFRNLSIPIMAAGPAPGELYATYADYRAASSPNDADGMQADVMVVGSTNGGLSWSSPKVVNKDNGDADQFQPAASVTPAGQLDISFFDRRKDPDNFYIDTYLARSNDGGASFKETRVSHDMWNPQLKAPTSPSGKFIGDYQGMVADDCGAHPFVNDTHLANKRGRDPSLDHGLPRTPFQQAITWKVPNRAKFGGEPVSGANC